MKSAGKAIFSAEQSWVDWVNAILRQHDLQLYVKDLRRDLSDGTVLAVLVECLALTKPIKHGTVTRRVTTTACHASQDLTMPKRQEERRYTVSTHIPPASSSLFKSYGFQNSHRSPSFVATTPEAFPRVTRRSSQLLNGVPQLLGTSSSLSEGVMLKQDQEGFRIGHSLSECSSEMETDVNEALLKGSVVYACNQDENINTARIHERVNGSNILVFPHGRTEPGVWNGSDESDSTDLSDSSTQTVNAECVSTQKANSQVLHGIRSQSTSKYKISDFDCLSVDLLQTEHVTPGAMVSPQTLKVDESHCTQQQDNEPGTHSLAMTISRLLVDSSFPEQNIQRGRKYATHIIPSPSVDILCTAHSSETAVVGADDMSMLQLPCDIGGMGGRLVEADISKLREASNVPPGSDSQPVNFNASQQKEYVLYSEQAGSCDDKVFSSDCDSHSSSSSESLTGIALDDTRMMSSPTVGETVTRHGRTVCTARQADDFEMKSSQSNGMPTVSSSHPKLPSTSNQLLSSTNVMSMEQTAGNESVRNDKERSLAESNIAVRRLRRELETADSRASDLSSKLKSSVDKMASYKQHIEMLQGQLRTVMEESQMKDSELVKLKITLESLEEESADRVFEKSRVSSSSLQYPATNFGNTVEKDGETCTVQESTGGSGDSVTNSSVSGQTDKKRKRSPWKPTFPFRRKKSSTSSVSSEVSANTGPNPKGSELVMEEKAFNGISQLEGKLMDSQAEIAHLALTNEVALKDAETLHATVRSLEKQLSDFMHDVDEKLCSPTEVVGRPYSPRLSPTSVSPLPEFLTDDDLGDCQTLTMYVHNGEDYKDQQVVAISNVQISVTTTWNVMDSKVLSTFEHHLSKLDGKTCLGLSQHSVLWYWLGDVRRIVGAQEMDTMSPHQAALRNKAAVIVHLQGAHEGSCDALSFHTLIPERFLKAYTSLLLSYHKVLISGPQLSGKSFLGVHLMKYCLVQLGVHVPDKALSVSSMDGVPLEKTGEIVTQLLKHNDRKHLSFGGIILDDIGSFEQLAIITQTLSAITKNVLVVAIMTLSGQHKAAIRSLSHHLWTWRQIQLWCHCEPIYSLLERVLFRQLIKTQTNGQNGMDDPILASMIKWVCQVWQRVSRVLDCCSGILSVKGPCQFFDCPMNTRDLEVWFTLLWNHMILPYLTVILRISCCENSFTEYEWGEDLVGWILEGVPWTDQSQQSICPPVLKLEAGDLRLQENIHRVCKTACSNGNRDEFLDRLTNLLTVLVNMPALPPFPPAQKKTSWRSTSQSQKIVRHVSFSPATGIVQSVL